MSHIIMKEMLLFMFEISVDYLYIAMEWLS